mmetsp:Transcript_45721/g.118275  ORF Transcript_45721/g.118275 Transcript_45721/m.118275 type:complete len:304 (-) Transcript_45721:21-932(-)
MADPTETTCKHRGVLVLVVIHWLSLCRAMMPRASSRRCPMDCTPKASHSAGSIHPITLALAASGDTVDSKSDGVLKDSRSMESRYLVIAPRPESRPSNHSSISAVSGVGCDGVGAGSAQTPEAAAAGAAGDLLGGSAGALGGSARLVPPPPPPLTLRRRRLWQWLPLRLPPTAPRLRLRLSLSCCGCGCGSGPPCSRRLRRCLRRPVACGCGSPLSPAAAAVSVAFGCGSSLSCRLPFTAASFWSPWTMASTSGSDFSISRRMACSGFQPAAMRRRRAPPGMRSCTSLHDNSRNPTSTSSQKL